MFSLYELNNYYKDLGFNVGTVGLNKYYYLNTGRDCMEGRDLLPFSVKSYKIKEFYQERPPHSRLPKFGDELIVWDDPTDKHKLKCVGVTDKGLPMMMRYFDTMKQNPYAAHGYCVTIYKHWEFPKEVKEYTMQEIADKMGIPINELRIKK